MRINPALRIPLCILWLLAAATGLALVLRYENTAGPAGRTPAHWPSNASIALAPHRDTLVMFAHPQCPCTRASVEELNRLLARCSGLASCHVVFFQPSDLPATWAHSDLWRSAAAIPGVLAQEDRDGATARLFGAQTSGFVVLYNPQGKLLFQGGITSVRGHMGDNAGETALVSLLQGKVAAFTQTPVFGCSLLNEDCATN